MDNIGQLTNCTGCLACIDICPNHAITQISNNNGELRPFVIIDKCTKCKLCVNRCPKNNTSYSNNTPQCFAVWANDELRKKSTSGGIFSVLAKTILDQNGIVFGAQWSDKTQVEILPIWDENELDKIRHSKYLHSYAYDSYKQVKKYLEEGKNVLYSGLPCQIAGLNAYLGKKYEKLITIDIICGQAPSPKYFYRYITESADINKINQIIFRNAEAWNPHTHDLIFDDGHVERRSQWDGNAYQIAYSSTIMASESCKKCPFNRIPRQGDISIGDFWGISKINPKYDDGLGTSIVLINTTKGSTLLQNIKSCLELCEEVNLQDALCTPNRIDSKEANYYLPLKEREDFSALVNKYPFSKSVTYGLKKHFDFGIVTALSYNYGGNLTYYALYNLLADMGYTSIFIDRREDAPSPPHKDPYKMFKNIPYPNCSISSPSHNYEEIVKYNELCDKMILGSDQMWNPRFIEKFGYHTCLDWVHADKVKLAYAASFGKDSFDADEYLIEKTKLLLKRFNKISVREQSAKKLLTDIFDIESEVVLDPVFLCDISHYEQLSRNSELTQQNGPYIAGYILDPSHNKSRLIKELSKIKKLDSIIIGDSYIPNEKYAEYDIDCLDNPYVEDWLYNIINCNYFITDSFHGACFALIFNKPFTLIINKYRGRTRIETLSSLFNIADRIIEEEESINKEKINKKINYVQINKTIKILRKKSIDWLNDALKCQSTETMPDKQDEIINAEIIANKQLSEEQNELIEQLKNKAIQGEEWATIRLIDLLMESKNKLDQKKAFTLCNELVNIGLRLCGKLSIMYKKGIGVDIDSNKAEHMLYLSSENGSKWAQVEYIDYLMKSDNADKKQKCYELCKKYILEGNTKLYGKMYLILLYGYGVEKNEVQALHYLNLAVDSGSQWAKKEYQKYESMRDGTK